MATRGPRRGRRGRASEAAGTRQPGIAPSSSSGRPPLVGSPDAAQAIIPPVTFRTSVQPPPQAHSADRGSAGTSSRTPSGCRRRRPSGAVDPSAAPRGGRRTPTAARGPRPARARRRTRRAPGRRRSARRRVSDGRGRVARGDGRDAGGWVHRVLQGRAGGSIDPSAGSAASRARRSSISATSRPRSSPDQASASVPTAAREVIAGPGEVLGDARAGCRGRRGRTRPRA